MQQHLMQMLLHASPDQVVNFMHPEEASSACADALKRSSAAPWNSDLVAGLRPWGQAAPRCLSAGAFQPSVFLWFPSVPMLHLFPPSASSGGSL